MLKYRVLTILLLLPLVFGLIFYAPLSWQRGVLALLMLGAWYEWVGLTPNASVFEKIISSFVLLLLAVLTHLKMNEALFIKCLWGGALFYWTVFVPLWLKYQQRRAALINLLIGAWLLAAFFAAMSYLLHHDNVFFVAGMALVWVSDTMAYIGGRSLGRHKLAPSVSPGKTWEGFVVGTLSAALYGVWVAYYLKLNVPPLFVALIAFVLAAYGVVGDLFESLLKRHASKKDSGSLLPGHGGILDRIDALFPVMPWLALLYMFYK